MGADRERVAVVHAPPRLSGGLSVGFAIAATLSMTPAGVGLVAGTLGTGLVAVGLFVRPAGWAVHLAGIVLVGGALGAAAVGLPPGLVLLAAGFGILSWDVGDHAIGLGDQLGRDADTTRNEVVHVAASVIVIGTVSAVGYATFVLSPGSRPMTALVLLIFGTLLLLWALGR